LAGIRWPGGGDAGLPGTVFSTQGIWYDLGNIGAGFDNNGDLTPDRNAWMQPVGNPDAYDPDVSGSIARMVSSLSNSMMAPSS